MFNKKLIYIIPYMDIAPKSHYGLKMMNKNAAMICTLFE